MLDFLLRIDLEKQLLYYRTVLFCYEYFPGFAYQSLELNYYKKGKKQEQILFSNGISV